MSDKLKLIHPMSVPGDTSKIWLMAYSSVDRSVITKWAVVEVGKPWAKPLRDAFAGLVDTQTLKTLIRNKREIARRMGTEWGATWWVGPLSAKPHFIIGAR